MNEVFSTLTKMSNALKVPFHPQRISLDTSAALFHSTAVSERKRKTHWDSGAGAFGNSSKRFNNNEKRYRKMEEKRTLLRNVSAYAQHLFQSWQSGTEENSQTVSSKPSSWYRKAYWDKGTKRYSHGSQESPWESYRRKGNGGFRFCFGDDEEVETIIQSRFGEERVFYWSFTSTENFQWRHSTHHSSYRSSWNWRGTNNDYYDDDSTVCNFSVSDLSSDRLALGLSASGPLKLEDVKNAYRTCALRWHPDRHQGSSKADAEEKFKNCSAAYQSLCDKLGAD